MTNKFHFHAGTYLLHLMEIYKVSLLRENNNNNNSCNNTFYITECAELNFFIIALLADS